jgi:tRNA (uracil-5-)-methyltransferase TRM9
MTTNREVFEDIAESWYRLRHWSRFKTELTEFCNRWHQGKLLNVGCAHGPDFLPFKDSFELVGIDFSEQMIKLAMKYAAKFGFEADLAVADASCLPFASQTFDCAVAVASYHHISEANQRISAFQELRRVLKPGGEAFLTVWNRGQPRLWFKGKEVFVPWRLRGKSLNRYHYLYSYHELRNILVASGFKVIGMFPEKSYNFPVRLFSRNICALIKVI